MTPKLFKAADVCELAQVQPYVLRSWEKEFPGIGVQKSAEAPRLYRQADVDQVLRIKQLVFGEGLTVAGARRRLEESAPQSAAATAAEVAEVLDTLGAHARTRIATVRDGLRALQTLLSKGVGEFELQPTMPAPKRAASPGAASARAASTGAGPKTGAPNGRANGKAHGNGAGKSGTKAPAAAPLRVASRGKAAKPAPRAAGKKDASPKRRRANA